MSPSVPLLVITLRQLQAFDQNPDLTPDQRVTVREMIVGCFASLNLERHAAARDVAVLRERLAEAEAVLSMYIDVLS